jgi:hypothetical protein
VAERTTTGGEGSGRGTEDAGADVAGRGCVGGQGGSTVCGGVGDRCGSVCRSLETVASVFCLRTLDVDVSAGGGLDVDALATDTVHKLRVAKHHRIREYGAADVADEGRRKGESPALSIKSMIPTQPSMTA